MMQSFLLCNYVAYKMCNLLKTNGYKSGGRSKETITSQSFEKYMYKSIFRYHMTPSFSRKNTAFISLTKQEGINF